MTYLAFIAAAVVGGTFPQQLLAPAGAAADFFGYSCAISEDGSTAALGAPFDNTGAGSDAGSVEVFVLSAGTYVHEQTITASDAAAGDLFGISVALSADGNTLAVGASVDDNSGGSNAGSTYVFTRSAGTWTQQQRIQASDAASGDEFGFSVSLSADGNTLAVGSFKRDIGGFFPPDAGSVYIFTRSGSTWTEQQILEASDADSDDRFGQSVALTADGDTCVIGAPLDNNSGGTNAGSVYIFTRSGSTWTEQQRIQAADATANDLFGTNVSARLDTLAAGTGNTTGTGSAYVFTRSGSTWSQQQRIDMTTGPGGIAVSLSDDSDTLLIGSELDDGAASDSGRGRSYTRSGGTWTQHATYDAPDGATGDRFGWCAALSGDAAYALFGAYADDSSKGSAWVFEV